MFIHFRINSIQEMQLALIFGKVVKLFLAKSSHSKLNSFPQFEKLITQALFLELSRRNYA